MAGLAGPAGAIEPVRIGVPPTGLLIWIADGLGLFEEAGVAVELEPVGSGVTTARRAAEGSLDFGASSEYAFVSQSQDSPGLCIYATISATRSVRLLARGDRVGPDPADLVGKRIGVVFGAAARFLLWQYLTLRNIPLADIVLVDLDPDEIVAAMVDGTIDAGMIWEPFATSIRHELSVGVVEYPDQMDQHYYFVLHGACEMNAKRRESLERVLAALVEAEMIVRRDPDRAKEAVSRRLGLSRQDVDHIWTLHSFNVVLPQDLLFLLEMEARWRHSEGLAAADIADVLSIVDPEPLGAVAPRAVQMVR